jgi:hypothetical protein
MLTGGEAIAQVNFEGFQVQSASGSLATNYDGQYGTDVGSSHGLGMGGSVNSSGYYYSPNFLSLTTSAFYDRAQSNSTNTSLDTSRGYYLNSKLFGGSSIPGNVDFGQSWGKDGSYGVPGQVGLYSTNDNRDFGVSWLFQRLSVFKNIAVGFSDSDSHSVVPGVNITSEANRKSYTIGTSGYNFWGFPLSGGYEHLTVSGSSNLYDNGESVESNSSTTDVYKVMSGHTLPYHGKSTFSAYRMVSSSNTGGENWHSTSDELDASISARAWRFPLGGSISYNDNVYGELVQELNASGQTIELSENAPKIGTLSMNLSTSYPLPHRVFLTAYASHQVQYYGSSSSSSTSYGANVAYSFSKLAKGLSVVVGMHDTASQQGNTGGSVIATVSYTRSFGGWHVFGNFNYNQNVETLLAIYTSSSMSSSAAIRRQARHGLIFGASAGYSRSVFTNLAGSQNYSENANLNASWMRQAVTASYAKSGGTAIISTTGLVPVTTPGLIANGETPFSGYSYQLGYSSQIVRRLTLNLGWSKFISDSKGSGVLSNVSSKSYNGYLTYNYRKLNFNAGAAKAIQGATGSSAVPANTVVYSFGVTRWFNFF